MHRNILSKNAHRNYDLCLVRFIKSKNLSRGTCASIQIAGAHQLPNYTSPRVLKLRFKIGPIVLVISILTIFATPCRSLATSDQERNEAGSASESTNETNPPKKKKKIQAKGSVLTATDDCGCVGGVRQLDPRDHGARRESLQVRWPVQPRAWTQVPPRKSTYVEASHKTTLTWN